MNISLKTKNPEETQSLGLKIGKLLEKGDIVALIGELGAGKTCFVNKLLEGLEVDALYKGTSPTFTLINEYNGRLSVYHFDIYRLNDIKEVIDLGYEEYFYGNGVAIIEWADKIEELLPKDCLRIYFKITGETEREINIQGSKDLKL